MKSIKWEFWGDGKSGKTEGERGLSIIKYFIYMYENTIMKSSKNCLKGWMGIQKSNGWAEFDQSTLCAGMRISERNHFT
jgi:hypothetical protein